MSSMPFEAAMAQKMGMLCLDGISEMNYRVRTRRIACRDYDDHYAYEHEKRRGSGKIPRQQMNTKARSIGVYRCASLD